MENINTKFNEEESILAIISAVKSDAFSRLIKSLAINIANYYTKKDIRNTDAVILNEIAEGKSLMEIKKTLAEKWNLTPERVRQLISKTFRRILHSTIISKIENGIESRKTLINENEMLKYQIKLLEEYIAKKNWENPPIAISDKDFDKIDFSQMSVRLCNVLKTNDIIRYKDVLNLSYSDVLKFRCLGKKSAKELKNFMLSKGYNVDWQIF